MRTQFVSPHMLRPYWPPTSKNAWVTWPSEQTCTADMSSAKTGSPFTHGVVLAAAHPQGPLALANLIGIDTTKAVAESLYEEFKEPLYAAPPLLNRMLDA